VGRHMVTLVKEGVEADARTSGHLQLGDPAGQ